MLALGEDWAAWREAWQALDAGPLADFEAAATPGSDARLTLCGERFAETYAPAAVGLWQKLIGRRQSGPAAAVLEAL